jgi:RNA polymerase sigma factor (sigma-70 family)
MVQQSMPNFWGTAASTDIPMQVKEPAMRTDEDLLRAFVRERSREAFDEILRRHGGLVFGVCRRSLGDLQEAEDAAQSVFLVFLEKAPRLGGSTPLGAWLYRTAVFVSRNRIRARMRRERPMPGVPTPAEPPAWDEAKAHLDDALARLPQRLQDALVVHYLQGKTLVETAATLDCPLKTLEKRVGRGLQRLRELLGGAGVAIGSAALVALLQQEARGESPARVEEELRRRPIPAARALLLPKLLFPPAAAILVLTIAAGAFRATRRDDAGVTGPVRRAVASSAPGRAAGTPLSSSDPEQRPPDAATLRSFPATFQEFAALYWKMYQYPEDVERWTALGADVREDDVRAVVTDAASSENVDRVIVALFRRWAGRDPRPAADWLYRAYGLLATAPGWTPQRASSGGPANLSPMEAVLDAWVTRDPKAAEAWVRALPAGVARNSIQIEYLLVSPTDPRRRSRTSRPRWIAGPPCGTGSWGSACWRKPGLATTPRRRRPGC